MAYNGIIFPLLRIKMALINIDVKTIADGIEMNRETLSRKLNGKNDLLMPEAYRIRDKFFKDERIDELFDPEWRPTGECITQKASFSSGRQGEEPGAE